MDFKNQWDTDDENASKKDPATSTNVKQDNDDNGTGNTEKPDTSTATTNLVTQTDSPTVSDATPTDIPPTISTTNTFAVESINPDTHKARRFLIAYMTTVFSALSILYGTAWLGYVLTDHFLGPKKASDGWFYIDFAPFYIALMASLTVFGIIYIIASRYVAKSASNDTIGLKDWRAYKVVYAFFTALLLTTGASVVAGLAYIPLAQIMIADDLDAKRILVQTVASLHVLAWIGLLIWQERLVRKAKHSIIQGFVVVAGVAIVVLATGIFPVGSKTDERFDNRVASDLSAIESAIDVYQSKNKKFPDQLASLTFEEDDTVKGRLKSYTYQVKTTQPTTNNQAAKVSASVGNNSTSDFTYSEDMSELDEEAYYNAMYDSMYNQQTASKQQSYELCATFRTDTTSKKNEYTGTAILNTLSGTTTNQASFTDHKQGKVCFTRT